MTAVSSSQSRRRGALQLPSSRVLALAAAVALVAPPAALAQNPNTTVVVQDFTMYSSAATTSLGVSGVAGATYTHSALAFAVVQNSTLTGWTLPLTPNSLRIAARWSTSFANQTATKPILKLFKSTPSVCYIHKGQSPLCAMDSANQIGTGVTMPLPSTIASSFSVMDIDLTNAGWTMNADQIYFIRFEHPVQTGAGAGIVAYQLGR